MSDWTKQTENLMSTWADSQKKMWDNWFKAMESMGAGANLKGFEAERQKVVDTWEASVKKGLDAQADWAKMWVDSLAEAKGTPKPMIDWAKQMQEMMKTWTSSQAQFSQMWFDMVKKMDGSSMADGWEDRAKEMMHNWQQAVDQTLAAQQNMTKFWSEIAKTTTAKKA